MGGLGPRRHSYGAALGLVGAFVWRPPAPPHCRCKGRPFWAWFSPLQGAPGPTIHPFLPSWGSFKPPLTHAWGGSGISGLFGLFRGDKGRGIRHFLGRGSKGSWAFGRQVGVMAVSPVPAELGRHNVLRGLTDTHPPSSPPFFPALGHPTLQSSSLKASSRQPPMDT